jgi:hypothetical protein
MLVQPRRGARESGDLGKGLTIQQAQDAINIAEATDLRRMLFRILEVRNRFA